MSYSSKKYLKYHDYSIHVIRMRCKRLAIGVIIVFGVISTSSAYTIDIGTSNAIGNYLVDERGMTLYYFANDQPKVTTCFDSCSITWPPFYAGSIDIPSDLKRGDFDQMSRADGRYQTTYKGMPLYLYSGDRNQGDINGMGVSGRWFAVKP